MDDELTEQVQQEVAGLRRDTRDLRDSIDSFDAKIEQKADAATAAAIEKLETGRQANRRRATVAVAVGVVALVLVLAALALVVRSNSDRISDQSSDVHARRVADCKALGAIAEANIAGANRIVINPVQRDAYAMGMRDAYDEIKRSKGYSADCSVIGDPPK